MHHLVLFAHPNNASFSHAILDTVVDGLTAAGHTVDVRDLYALNFQPVLQGSDLAGFRSGNIPDDIRIEQEHVSRADSIIVIHPLWWTGLPAILKGWFDRVFSFGFAYSFNETGLVRLLAGKRAVIFTTHGLPHEAYESTGMYHALTMTSDTGIFDFCGIEVVRHTFFSSVPSVDDATRKQYLEDVRTTVASL